MVLNKLDDDDKHRLLRVAFVYPDPAIATGLDLIEVRDARRVPRRAAAHTSARR